MPSQPPDPDARQHRVFVFAKAPRLGTVKTRLAATIGDTAALDFYRLVLAQTIERLQPGPWHVQLAVTPDASAADAHLWPSGIARIGQGPGDLGDRMLRLLALADADNPVVIVGSDIPAMDQGHVRRALIALAAADVVFGPAEDGGYWLIGMARKPPPTLFDNVRWSSPNALADTLANTTALSVAHADTLADVDDGAALARFNDTVLP